jgi:hypothetical protein
MGLRDVFTLPKASRYSNPMTPSDVLPIVYGNHYENLGAAIPTVLKAVCIDEINLVYALCCHPIWSGQTDYIIVYDDDGAIFPISGYTLTKSGNYEGQGDIAYLTLSSEPTGNVTVAFYGKADSDGNLITNPIAMIEDFLDLVGLQIDLPNRNQGSFDYAKALANSLSYTCAGAVTSDKEAAFWLNSMLSSFLGSFWINTDKELTIHLDSASTVMPIAGALNHDNKVIRTKGTRRLSNVVNQCKVSYARSYVQIDKRYSEGSKDAYMMVDDGESYKETESQDKYDVQLAELFLDFTRNTTTAQTIGAYLVQKLKDKKWIIDREEESFRNIQLEQGDYGLISWNALPDENGEPLHNQYMQVLTKDPDYDTNTQTFQVLLSDEFLHLDSGLWDGSASVGDGSWWNGRRDRRII